MSVWATNLRLSATLYDQQPTSSNCSIHHHTVFIVLFFTGKLSLSFYSPTEPFRDSCAIPSFCLPFRAMEKNASYFEHSKTKRQRYIVTYHNGILQSYVLLPCIHTLSLPLPLPSPPLPSPVDAAAPSLWHCTCWGGRPWTQPSEHNRHTRHVTPVDTRR